VAKIDWTDIMGSEVRAVGVSKDGRLLAIRNIEDVRGMTLWSLIVSVHHRTWFKEHEEMLRETFTMNLGHEGQIIIFGGKDSIAEAF
jgi:hypothetical protein